MVVRRRPQLPLLPGYLVSLFQNESSCKIFHMKTSLIYMKMNHKGKLIFIWFLMQTRFDIEAEDNLEMAYSYE